MSRDEKRRYGPFSSFGESVFTLALIGACVAVCVWWLPAWPWIRGGVVAVLRAIGPIVLVPALLLLAWIVLRRSRRS